MGEMNNLKENELRQERWAHLTEGIENNYDRIVLENLLDNTQKWINEASTTMNVTQFTTYAFPLIRRIFPSLVANDLVSVQPMSMPTGMIFFLDYKYANGDRMDYQGGKFNPYYSIGGRGVKIGTGDASNKVFEIGQKPVLKDTCIVYVNAVKTSDVTIDPVAGTVTFGTAPNAEEVITIDYNLDFEGNDNAPEITFDMASDTVTAEQRRLKAKWTLESQQDLYAYHGVDAEAELTALLGDEIAREIDRTIVNDLFASVGHNVNWSKTNAPGSGLSAKEHTETLLHALVDAELVMFKKRLVKPNRIVTSPEVCAMLEKLSTFRYDGGVEGGDINKGVNLFGTLKNKYRIYADPQAPADKILLAYKGSSFFETGYVYAPYIPLYTTPTIMDTDFVPRKALMTRYARKLVSSDFYASVTITE